MARKTKDELIAEAKAEARQWRAAASLWRAKAHALEDQLTSYHAREMAEEEPGDGHSE